MSTFTIAINERAFAVDYDYVPALAQRQQHEDMAINAACVGGVDVWDMLAPYWQEQIEAAAWQEARDVHNSYARRAA
ncbi:hypothetical protein IGB42_02973 [Andreprevotia sp. IGB-42]|uniref:hypothetical protein n=1 Tax=Andreprevotia sp. IGB-42 TaxID=2497473 RepID=UPI00135CB04B|nr:hypothetical protein [Andreprevotia sp. IGB-42]KAF0812681.1 hypothetical protein IGB42_02973 [Andreprevotia sp. IGB-42]